MLALPKHLFANSSLSFTILAKLVWIFSLSGILYIFKKIYDLDHIMDGFNQQLIEILKHQQLIVMQQENLKIEMHNLVMHKQNLEWSPTNLYFLLGFSCVIGVGFYFSPNLIDYFYYFTNPSAHETIECVGKTSQALSTQMKNNNDVLVNCIGESTNMIIKQEIITRSSLEEIFLQYFSNTFREAVERASEEEN